MRIVLLLVVALVACSKESAAPAQGHAPVASSSKDPATAKQLAASGAVVLDVRSPDEYSGDHLPTATNIPVGEVATRVEEVDKLVVGDRTKPVVVYCAAGGRAAKAKAALEAAGFTHVVNGGGLDDMR